jgi:hypothetical protein
VKIGPARTFQELKASGRKTSDRKGHPQLPGVKADALQMSPDEKYQDNRRLADAIGKLMMEMKGQSADGKPLFVIGWRLYPNKENREYWKDGVEEHVCSCACGCACILGPPGP